MKRYDCDGEIIMAENKTDAKAKFFSIHFENPITIETVGEDQYM